MTIDHIAWLLPLNFGALPYFMHVFGRITAPIMWFFVAEGVYHTKDWKRYFLRMLLFSIASHFAYCYYEGIPVLRGYTSVMWPLALSILVIKLCETKKLSFWCKLLPIFFLVLCSIRADWGVLALLMPAVLYKYRHSFKKQSLAITASGIAAALITNASFSYRVLQLFVCLSIPILSNYNKQRGNGNKWFFYIYYPLHLIILGVVSRLLSLSV